MNTLTTISTVVVCLICASTVIGDPTESDTQGRVHLSGVVAKLIPEHRVTIHSSKKDAVRSYSAPLKKSPILVDTSDFGAAYIDFEDQAGERVMAVMFNTPLFKDGRDVTIRLIRPALETRVTGSGQDISIHQWAWITEDVGYATMPRWNRDKDKLVAAQNPTVEIRVKGHATPIVSTVMENGCLGYGWRHLCFPPEGFG